MRGMLSDRDFLNFGAKSAESAVVVFAREWRRRKSARHAVRQGGDRDFLNFCAKSAESAVVVFAIESGEGGSVRGMLSDRARTELSVAVDIFQESLLYNCITKESDHLMCNIACITTLA